MMDLEPLKQALLTLADKSSVVRFCLAPLPARMLRCDRSCWDREHADGCWRRLNHFHESDFLQEAGHYLVIGGYQHALRPDDTILDVGCGTGGLQTVLARFGYWRYLGIDFSERAIREAEHNADAKTSFVVADATEFSTSERFGTIIFNETLYYFDRPGRVVERYARLLDKDGIIIVSMYSHGLRDGLMKVRIWQEIKASLALVHETAVSSPAFGPTWTVRVFRPR